MKNSIKTISFIFTLCVILSINAGAITRVAVGSGNWGNGATWSPSGVPACGDSVFIDATYTIDVTNQQNYTSCTQPLKVVIKGTLWFHQGTKIRFPCGSYVIVLPGGSINHDAGLSNSNFIEICSNVEWNSNSQTDGPFCLPPTTPSPACPQVLPVELTSFKGEVCEEVKICLSWETASEKNNDHYEVERSENAVDFKTVIAVASKAPGGNSQYKISYSGTDQTPVNGINYYRLKQVDKDLTSKNSKIITAKLALEKGLQFLIFPNANSGEFTAQITGLKNSGNISVFLRNPSGAIVYKAIHYVDANAAQIKVTPEMKLANGFYFCSFIIGETEHIVKIIVTNS